MKPQPIEGDVLWFAGRMQEKLRLHDKDRGEGWKACTDKWLLMRLKQEVLELEHVISCDNQEMPGRARAAIGECADIGNFAMMIADVIANKYGVVI